MRPRTTRKEKQVSPINTDVKILNNMLANKIQNAIKRIIHQVESIPDMQGCLTLKKINKYNSSHQ